MFPRGDAAHPESTCVSSMPVSSSRSDLAPPSPRILCSSSARAVPRTAGSQPSSSCRITCPWTTPA
eukprot:scaffold127949_cov27-Tisochrysis_lutea.AAC.1